MSENRGGNQNQQKNNSKAELTDCRQVFFLPLRQTWNPEHRCSAVNGRGRVRSKLFQLLLYPSLHYFNFTNFLSQINYLSK
jgi:hypothetical protein